MSSAAERAECSGREPRRTSLCRAGLDSSAKEGRRLPYASVTASRLENPPHSNLTPRLFNTPPRLRRGPGERKPQTWRVS